MNFDPDVWRSECEKLACEASKACGLSHDVYVSKFSGLIEGRLAAFSSEDQTTAFSIAREFDYATVSEIDEQIRWNSDNGYCQHGIDKDCCPAGCGDFEVV